ncbi:DUF5694 domain-containing protein [Parvularcula marina]|uniref:TraB/GumN family protein n=1 Tax=Parvularcula marina TaxID=2292771 RepID=A0A371REC6_9PROT|nr:DUF5694 domain-containing protein [Parvularcula marina]RFB03804.1 hypothetical protein DX908_00020 [Parvularcula marina]
MRLILSICLILLAALPARAEPDPDGEPIEVMVIGTWHFKNSGADVINVDGPNVLEAERQQELADVVGRLMAFEPTIVALERVTEAPDYIIKGFHTSPPDIMATNPNERVQLGYRLATAAGLDDVYGIDEQPSDGEPDYFPFNKLMEHLGATGQMPVFQAMMDEIQSTVATEMEAISGLTIADGLIRVNEGLLSSPELYYLMASFDEGEAQPAAELQGYWFMRNTKIFSKLLDIAEPGDRIVVIYGAGHKHWLDHLAEHTPGVTLVDPVPYLRGD